MTTTSSTSPLCLLAALAAVLVLPSCGDDALAKVGRTRLDQTDLEAFVSRRAPGNRELDLASLQALAERQLLAEAARRDDLDEDRLLQAEIEAAKREILAHAYLERSLAPATSEAALRRRYEAQRDALSRARVHVRHILLRLPEDEEGRTQARSRANAVYARLRDGEDFEALAKRFSDDEVTAGRGGDLGAIIEGEVDAGLFAEAAALDPGEVSPPVESPYGIHLLQAVDAPDELTPTFEEARGRLAADARREARQALLDRLREEVPVELHPERLHQEESAR